MTQIGLFEGRQRRDKGLAKVSQGFDWWLEQARFLAEKIAREQGRVSSDQIHEVCPLPEEAHPNLMGAVFKDSRFEPVGYIPSQRPSAHGRIIRIYCIKQ
jgi:hypothetical protein